MVADSVAVKGVLQIKKLNLQGEVTEIRTVNNFVVALGKAVIASRLVGNTTPIFSHMAIGSANTVATTSQTSLGTELGRVAITSSSVTNNTIAYIATFPAGTGTGTLTEAGIFNASNSGSMLCRTNFNALTKSGSDTIVITWNVTIF